MVGIYKVRSVMGSNVLRLTKNMRVELTKDETTHFAQKLLQIGE